MSVLRPLLIAGLVLIEVGLWQWRMVVAARGNRAGAVLLGACGAVLQITAIGQVVTNVTDPLSVGAYAAGVGIGVLLGMVAGDRFTPGTVGVTVITMVHGVADGLWALGWPATVQVGHGEDGPVTVLFVAINRRHEVRLRRDLAQLAPEAFCSTGELRASLTQLAPSST
jgi:uncharacterized protein YebE (UPF0316 family)